MGVWEYEGVRERKENDHSMKIAFIGGGSVQWTPKLVTDMALNERLTDATLMLHDIDAEALELLTQACERIVEEVDGALQITPTLVHPG